MTGLRRYGAWAQAYIAAAAAAVAVAALLLANVSALAQAPPVEHTGPSIILGPPPGETATETPAEPPPIARKKPQREKASAPKPRQQEAPAKKPAQKKAPAKKAPAKPAPAKTEAPPPQQTKACDYCYGCLSSSHACRRQWVCGKRYSELLAAGLCRR